MAARFEMQKEIAFLTFEQFLERKKQGTDFFLKSVGPSPVPEISTHSDVPDDTLAADEAREAGLRKQIMAGHEVMADSEPQTTPEPAAVDTGTKSPVADFKQDNATSKPIASTPESAATLPNALEAMQPPASVPEEETILAEPLLIMELVSDPPHEEFGDGATEKEAA